MAGDALVFPSGVTSTKRSATNTFGSGTAFPSMLIQDIGYTISGSSWNVSQFVEMSAGTGTSTVNTPLTLAASPVAVKCAGSRSTLALGGPIDLAGHTLSLEANPGQIQINGNITNSGVGGGVTKSGAGTVTVAGGTSLAAPSGFDISAGRVILNGTCSNAITVAAQGTLAGTGSTASATVSGTLAPGESSTPSLGTFTVAGPLTLNSGSTVSAELSNTPTSSDRVNASGAITIQSGANLSVSLPSPLRFSIGDEFVVLKKTTVGSITGQFANAPANSTFTVGRVTFFASYSGGEVKLTVSDIAASNLTRVWDGGGNNDQWSNAQNWVGDETPESGDSLLFPAGAPRTAPINDLDPDFVINDLTVSSGASVFPGNRIHWIGNMTFSHTTDDMIFGLPVQVGTNFFQPSGIVTLTGTRRLTWNGAVTEIGTNRLLYFKNEATAGGGLRISSAFTFGGNMIAARNNSTTPIEWRPPSASTCQSLWLYGSGHSFHGPGAVQAQTLGVGRTEGLLSAVLGSLSPATLTLQTGLVLYAQNTRIDAGSQILSAPGAAAQMQAGNLELFGNCSASQGAGGSLLISFNGVQATAGVSASLDASLVPLASPFGFDLDTGSAVSVSNLSSLVSGTGWVAGGGKLTVGPVSNISEISVGEASTLELAHDSAGSSSLDVWLGGHTDTNGTGHLAGRGSCRDVQASINGCTISPGTASAPYGILSFRNLQLGGITPVFEAAGITPGVNQDQIRVSTNANYGGFQQPQVHFINGYAPQPWDELVWFEHSPTCGVSGYSFFGMNQIIEGQWFLVYFLGGDGNDFAYLKRSVPLPVTGPSTGLPASGLQKNPGTGQWSFVQYAMGHQGITYVMEASTDLVHWSEVKRETAPSSFIPPQVLAPSAFSISVPADPVNQPKRFFRMRPL